MKRFITICILTILIFATLTISTARIEGPSDGDDIYGYPVTFFIQHSGMCSPCPPDMTEIHYGKLILDLLFAAGITIIGWIILIRIIRSLKAIKRDA